MSQRQAVTKVRAWAYARGHWVVKTRILDEMINLTRWHRDYARIAVVVVDRLTFRGCIINTDIDS